MVIKFNIHSGDVNVCQLQKETKLLEFYLTRSLEDSLPWVKGLCDENKNRFLQWTVRC